MRNLLRGRLIVVIVVLLSGGLLSAVHADGIVGDGTATSCTEAALDTALAGGGSITFNCGGATTILLTGQKTITLDTTLDGGNLVTLSGANATRLFLVNGATTLTLNNMTLTNGYANDDGGAIFNNGTLVLNHSTIQKSQTTTLGSGGAIVSYGGLTITDSLIVENRAANGGALYVRSGSAMIQNSVLRQNATTSTTDGWGGALLLWAGVRVEIAGGEIAFNQARFGGGIHNRFATSSVTLHDGTLIHDNSTADAQDRGNEGGGIYNENGTVALINVMLQANKATGYAGQGGGITNAVSGTVTLTNVTLQGNSATGYGGGIYNLSGTVTLTNVTLQGNSATGYGGGLSNIAGTASLLYVTFQGNSASGGGGINHENNASASLSLKNVALADDTGGNCSFKKAPDSATFNLSTDLTCPMTDGSNRTNTPALLGPIQDNGGGLLTLLPQPNSPLIDGGQCVGGVTTDQRGALRPQGAACDIGAMEVVAVLPGTATPTTVPSPTTVDPTPTPTTPSPSPTSPGTQSRSVFLPLVQR